MISKERKKFLKLDPRTQILLLVFANCVAFTQRSICVEFSFVILLGILLFVCDCKKYSFIWVSIFLCLVFVQYFVFPIAPKYVSDMFSIIVMYARKIFPCLMVGTILVKKTPVRQIVTALQSWKVPQKIIIPLSITIRYFPAIKEEKRHIKEALKLRNIKGFSKIEYYLVPIMISATNTSEELSAAAVTRGIENPVKKTSLIELKFSFFDYFVLLVSIVYFIIALINR